MKYFSNPDILSVKEVIGKLFFVKTIEVCSACTSISYLVNDDTIVRFPKDEIGYQKLARESDVLGFLSSKKLAIQTPMSKIVFSNEYALSIHKIIEGDLFTNEDCQSLCLEKQNKFCQDIALFLFQLHSLTDEISSKIMLPQFDFFDIPRTVQDIKVLLLENKELTKNEKDFINFFLSSYEIPSSLNQKKVFGHFDMMAKNFAFDKKNNKINGVFDFGNCGISNLKSEFIKLALDYDENTVLKIATEYKNLSNIEIDLKKVFLAATFFRMSFLASSMVSRKLGKSTFYADNLFNLKNRIREV